MMNKRQILYVLDIIDKTLQEDDIESARINLFALGHIIGDEIIANNQQLDLTDGELSGLQDKMVEKLESIRTGDKDWFGSHSKN